MRALFLALLMTLMAVSPAWADRLIRIGILEQAQAATLSCSVDSLLMKGDRVLASLPASTSIDISLQDDELVVQGMDLAPTEGPLTLQPASPSADVREYLGMRPYRGTLEVRVGKGYLTVVNQLPLDQYLYGVVPCEVIPSWPAEALKCEAVAARTYALCNLGQFASLGYDLKATVASQAYGGARAETLATNEAVDETHGQVVTYHGRPIWAVYCDSTGGYTESSLAVWGKALPYLQPVPDFDQESPRYVWDSLATYDRIARAMARFDVNIGNLEDIEVLSRSFTGRVTKARLIGSQGTADVTGAKLRWAFGLRSTFFNVARQSDGAFLFAGRGWGHGVGMSQWGSKRLADMGYTYQQILGYYYPGTKISSDSLIRLSRR